MVPDVVEWRGCDEAVAHEPGQGRLAVERVLASEPDQSRVSLDPAVGCALISRVQDGRL